MTPKIPVTVLAGAMGAGKTTLINRIVSESGQRILVIQNELGEVTVEGTTVISTDEEIFEMDDGLVCGTVRGDLIRALVSVTRRREQYDRILIEATGPADPGPIVRTFLMDQEIQRSFRLDGLAMLVDGRLLSLYTEGKTGGHEQIVFANVLIVNKTDHGVGGRGRGDGALAALGQQHRPRPQHQLRQPAARAAAQHRPARDRSRARPRHAAVRRRASPRSSARARPGWRPWAASCRPRRPRAGASTSASSRARSRGATATPSWRWRRRPASSRSGARATVIRSSGARCTRAPSTRSRGSPGQARLATSGEDGAVRILQIGADEPVTVVRPGYRSIDVIAWSPKGDMLAVAKGDAGFIFTRRRQAAAAHPRRRQHDHRPHLVARRRGDRVLVLRRRARHRSDDGRAPAPPAGQRIDAEPRLEPGRQRRRVGLPGQQRALLALPAGQGHGVARDAAQAAVAELERRQPAAGHDRRPRRDGLELRRRGADAAAARFAWSAPRPWRPRSRSGRATPCWRPGIATAWSTSGSRASTTRRSAFSRWMGRSRRSPGARRRTDRCCSRPRPRPARWRRG